MKKVIGVFLVLLLNSSIYCMNVVVPADFRVVEYLSYQSDDNNFIIQENGIKITSEPVGYRYIESFVCALAKMGLSGIISSKKKLEICRKKNDITVRATDPQWFLRHIKGLSKSQKLNIKYTGVVAKGRLERKQDGEKVFMLNDFKKANL